eukprot:COSAG01_NODE_4664_length_4838_cov_5.744461_2_plen_311_part_00
MISDAIDPDQLPGVAELPGLRAGLNQAAAEIIGSMLRQRQGKRTDTPFSMVEAEAASVQHTPRATTAIAEDDQSGVTQCRVTPCNHEGTSTAVSHTVVVGATAQQGRHRETQVDSCETPQACTARQKRHRASRAGTGPRAKRRQRESVAVGADSPAPAPLLGGIADADAGVRRPVSALSGWPPPPPSCQSVTATTWAPRQQLYNGNLLVTTEEATDDDMAAQVSPWRPLHTTVGDATDQDATQDETDDDDATRPDDWAADQDDQCQMEHPELGRCPRITARGDGIWICVDGRGPISMCDRALLFARHGLC